MYTKTLDLICIAVLCTILTLGLWPFHAPGNDVTWLAGRHGLDLGKYGTVISSGAFQTANSQGNEPSGSVELWLQLGRVPDGGCLLSFFTPEEVVGFSLYQSRRDLRLRAAIPGDRHRTNTKTLYVMDVFHKEQPRFITVTAGAGGTAVYINGVLGTRSPQLRLPASPFTGRLVLGDSPGQPHSWTGQLLGFAIYDRELTPSQLSKHYETWTRSGRPEIHADEGNVALYLFDEHAGHAVHDHANSGVVLSIPERYVVVDQIFLEPLWKEFNMSQSYWVSALKNIVGFIPLGFCFCARLAMARHVKRAALTAVLLGALVSLTIEVLQAYLPTRDSGMTDIVTNTLGTWVGVMCFRSNAAQALLTMAGCSNNAGIADTRLN